MASDTGPVKRPLSRRQAEMLNFIVRYIEDHDYPPTIREIQEGCDISSTSVVVYNLDRLEGRGYITRSPLVSRTIRVVKQ